MKDDLEINNKRESDLLLGQLIAEVKEIRRLIDEREASSQTWRLKFEDKITNLQKIVDMVNTPFKATVWAFGIIGAMIITSILQSVISFVRAHFHFYG